MFEPLSSNMDSKNHLSGCAVLVSLRAWGPKSQAAHPSPPLAAVGVSGQGGTYIHTHLQKIQRCSLIEQICPVKEHDYI